jgi:hypothetical protein
VFDVKKLLSETDTSMIISQFLTRPDGLNHLLPSDIEVLLASLEKDFPDIV